MTAIFSRGPSAFSITCLKTPFSDSKQVVTVSQVQASTLCPGSLFCFGSGGLALLGFCRVTICAVTGLTKPQTQFLGTTNIPCGMTSHVWANLVGRSKPGQHDQTRPPLHPIRLVNIGYSAEKEVNHYLQLKAAVQRSIKMWYWGWSVQCLRYCDFKCEHKKRGWGLSIQFILFIHRDNTERSIPNPKAERR